ncbi:unnamed protein product [Oikopleura dioica]|uniref:Uncharacterized protein n=1 Tax=Oikopleura dioica TaxID=34765 RepID=E4X4F2_OIKDI|nr:unnamed protein product [Oikopleura dioica]
MRRNPYMLTIFNDELLKLAVIITAGIVFAEEICGFYPFGHDPHMGHGASASPAFNAVQINGIPEVQGDEHIRNYRGKNCVDNDHFMQPTSVTPENK